MKENLKKNYLYKEMEDKEDQKYDDIQKQDYKRIREFRFDDHEQKQRLDSHWLEMHISEAMYSKYAVFLDLMKLKKNHIEAAYHLYRQHREPTFSVS